jgi:SAM-dependent methyltransferase
VTPAEEPKLYRELAPWFHLLTAPNDYAEEAALYGRLLVEKSDGEVETVLELGSGGGNNASHMKRDFVLTLVDRSPAMLELSRGLNPDVEHVEGDMRSVRLDRTFDAVFVHDALAYILTEADLQAVFETAAAHCRPGGSRLRPGLRRGDVRDPHQSRRP